MGQVAVTMNGRTYRLRCGDGEEPRLLALAAHLGGKVDQLVREFGQVGEDRLMLMAALLVCDEMFDARERLATAAKAAESLATPAAEPDARPIRKDEPAPAHGRRAGAA
jgi:cell division protein ZapA